MVPCVICVGVLPALPTDTERILLGGSDKCYVPSAERLMAKVTVSYAHGWHLPYRDGDQSGMKSVPRTLQFQIKVRHD